MVNFYKRGIIRISRLFGLHEEPEQVAELMDDVGVELGVFLGGPAFSFDPDGLAAD